MVCSLFSPFCATKQERSRKSQIICVETFAFRARCGDNQENCLLGCDALQFLDSFVSQELIMLNYVSPSYYGPLVSFRY